MALIFRDTKGSPLTSAEADANVRQLAISATYTAGSGVVISAANVISATNATGSSALTYLRIQNDPSAYATVNATNAFVFVTIPYVSNNIRPGAASLYDASNSSFVPPVTGLYMINFILDFVANSLPAGTGYYLGISPAAGAASAFIQGTLQQFTVGTNGGGGGRVVCEAFLTAGQEVAVVCWIFTTTTPRQIGAAASFRLLSAS